MTKRTRNQNALSIQTPIAPTLSRKHLEQLIKQDIICLFSQPDFTEEDKDDLIDQIKLIVLHTKGKNLTRAN